MGADAIDPGASAAVPSPDSTPCDPSGDLSVERIQASSYRDLSTEVADLTDAALVALEPDRPVTALGSAALEPLRYGQ